jgi:hypothetical protein
VAFFPFHLPCRKKNKNIFERKELKSVGDGFKTNLLTKPVKQMLSESEVLMPGG